MSISTLLMLAGGIIFLVSLGLQYRDRVSQTPLEQDEQKTQIVPDETSIQVNRVLALVQNLHSKMYKAFGDDVIKEIGDTFETYVISKFDIEDGLYTFVDSPSDKHYGGDVYPESNQNPDFQLDLNADGKKWPFAVECKRRNTFSKDDTVKVTYPAQLARYQNYEKNTKRKTFLVLGVGGRANAPESMFIIPIMDITDPVLTKRDLLPYFQEKTGASYLNYRFEYNHKEKALKFLPPRN